jgi:hypothetical protein
MIENYYLDESGNSGDLIKIGAGGDFGGQPFFALACIGVADPGALGQEINRLKTLHKVRTPELKSSALDNKPGLVADLMHYIACKELPVMIEVVDKRFHICISIVNHHILPVGAIDHEPMMVQFKTWFVEYLYELMPDAVMAAFIAACLDPTRPMVRASLGQLAAWLFGRRSEDEIAGAILRGVAGTLSECDAMPEGSKDYLNFLPDPDDSKHGKPFWMLPNLSCFTNIYARINRRHNRRIAGVTLFHDELLTYDHILENGKISAESLFERGVRLHAPHADYQFTEQASLAFARSDTSPGIQAADVLAGLLMRRMKDRGQTRRTGGEALDEAFGALLGMTDSERGVGINFVAPASLLMQMGIGWS